MAQIRNHIPIRTEGRLFDCTRYCHFASSLSWQQLLGGASRAQPRSSGVDSPTPASQGPGGVQPEHSLEDSGGWTEGGLGFPFQLVEQLLRRDLLRSPARCSDRKRTAGRYLRSQVEVSEIKPGNNWLLRSGGRLNRRLKLLEMPQLQPPMQCSS